MPDRPVPESPGGAALRARALIHREDPRIPVVEAQLAVELGETLSPDRVHYLGALAVAALDARAELADRSARHTVTGRAYRAGAGAVVVLLMVLSAAVAAAAVAGVVALWGAVLS